MDIPHIILASASPRRQELLRSIGVPFRVIASEVDERIEPLPPEVMVVALARRKAAAVAASVVSKGPDSGPTLIIGADTVVVCDNEVLGKPADAGDARRMLELLSGREHRALTGLALVLLHNGAEQWTTGFEETLVRFAPLSPEEISRYIETGEPLDKAGAYGIQGQAAVFVEGITGCYLNVVGLPLRRLYVLAGEKGMGIMADG